MTEDKLRLCLQGKIEAIASRQAWMAPAGIFITLLATLLTTTFKDFGLSKATWEATFVLSSVVAFGWLLKCIFSAKRAPSMDEIVAEVKRGRLSSATDSKSSGSESRP